MLPTRFSLFSFVLFLAAGALVLAGCDSAGPGLGEEEEPPPTSTSGQVDVALVSAGASTQAASFATASRATATLDDIEEASVTISRVELSGEGGSYTLSDDEQEFDLLDLDDPVDLAFGDDVPAGEYDRLLLTVSDTHLELDDGSTPGLEVPSGKIRLLLPSFEITEGGDSADITVEFDTDRSFVETGRGTYLFRPVLRTRSVESNGDDLSGKIELDGRVTAYAPGESISVEGLPFAITGRTDVEDDDEALAVGRFVELEAYASGGRYEAREIEVEDDDSEVTLEAPLGEVRSDALVLLGVSFAVDAETDFNDFDRLEDLANSRRVDVEFVYDEESGAYRLLEIEAESSGTRDDDDDDDSDDDDDDEDDDDDDDDD